MPVFADCPALFGVSDSETLQNAVNAAVNSDDRTVIVPALNARTGRAVWDIDCAVRLPSDITVIPDGCHLRLADGVFDNIFRNAVAGTPEATAVFSQQHGIHLLARNDAHRFIGNGKIEILCN